MLGYSLSDQISEITVAAVIAQPRPPCYCSIMSRAILHVDMLRILKNYLDAAGLVVAWVAFLLWAVTRIRYTVGGRHVRVRLGKLTLRKVALSDIASADTRMRFWNEHWCNT